jgi:hypothetical protein
MIKLKFYQTFLALCTQNYGRNKQPQSGMGLNLWIRVSYGHAGVVRISPTISNYVATKYVLFCHISQFIWGLCIQPIYFTLLMQWNCICEISICGCHKGMNSFLYQWLCHAQIWPHYTYIKFILDNKCPGFHTHYQFNQEWGSINERHRPRMCLCNVFYCSTIRRWSWLYSQINHMFPYGPKYQLH